MATINRKTRTFTDINLNFSAHPATRDIVTRIDEDAVKASVKNLVSTKNFERPFHPEIGCQVYSLLFNNFTPMTTELVRKTVEEVIVTYEPRVRLIDVRVNQDDDRNGIEIAIEFMLINSEKPITVTTFLERTR